MNKKIRGIVVSGKMEKTAVIKAQSWKTHPLYQKKYRQNKKYQAHDPENQLKAGDKVLIEECRPLSQNKRWRVVREKE